jgi:acetoacetyl-CoA synthetase
LENRDRLRDPLQAICERVLDLSPIGGSDNLLEVGVDSLALVNLLLEIERRTGRRLSLPGLLAEPSVDAMARTLLLGMALLAAALRDESVTYTSFTPIATTWAALVAQGFVQLESHMIVMPPMAQAGSLLARPRPVITFNPATVRPKLSERQKRIFDDHPPYDCLQLLVEEGTERAYVVAKRRVHRPAGGTRLGALAKLLPVRFAYSDILHCSSPELLARHLERVKLAILRPQRTAALAAEARLFPVRPRGMLHPRRTCYRSHTLRPGDVDRLYSEFVLLPI